MKNDGRGMIRAIILHNLNKLRLTLWSSTEILQCNGSSYNIETRTSAQDVQSSYRIALERYFEITVLIADALENIRGRSGSAVHRSARNDWFYRTRRYH